MRTNNDPHVTPVMNEDKQWSTCDTRHEWGQDRIMTTTNVTYSWSFKIQLSRNG